MKKIKIGLLVEEFFDKDLGGYGGYGMLARNYIARYLSNEEFEVEVIIGKNNSRESKVLERDGIKIHYIPRGFSYKYDFFYRRKMEKFFSENKFDIYLSIEMPKIALEIFRVEKDKKLILWLQDPRPQKDWEEIKSLEISSEYESNLNYYKKIEKENIKILEKLYKENRLKVITQGKFLIEKARDLYKIPKDLEITYVPNPVEIQEKFDISKKKNSIIFLGRLDAVKRPWLYFEIAKKLPEYIFYVCGQSHEKTIMDPIIKKYSDIKNLKFLGHVTGVKKDEILSETKILVNTSIHEAIPVSFLEAISYGAKIVSCQNPDDITKNNGYYTGVILGEGYDSVDKFKYGIEKCMLEYNEEEIKNSIEEISNNHSIGKFITNMKELILEEVKNG